MSAEAIQIIDPRRNLHVQGFSGRAATTTIHDATATGVSISGIFQAAEDYGVLGLWNAYDCFNYLRLKYLPKTNLSGLKLEFDIEYDHTLDGAMRLDAAKLPSVLWDAMTFVCGAGAPNDIYEVRLLDHATAVARSETPASCRFDADGVAPYYGIDYLHLYFRDTRYSVARTDCIVATTRPADVATRCGLAWHSDSKRDGFRCLNAQRLGPSTKRPVGPVIEVSHFHHARRSLLAAGDPINVNASIAVDKVVFGMVETTGNIWMLEIEEGTR